MDQRWADLYAAVARQAVHDLQTGSTHPRHTDATQWLEAAGLLEHVRTSGPVRRAGRNTTRTDVRIKERSPMAPLNIDEQAKVDRVAELETKRARGAYVSDHELAQAKTIAENQVRNAEWRAAHRAQLKAERDAAEAKRQGKYDQAAQAAQDQHMRQRRAAFRGTAAQWEAMKDRILEDYLLSDEAVSPQPVVEF